MVPPVSPGRQGSKASAPRGKSDQRELLPPAAGVYPPASLLPWNYLMTSKTRVAALEGWFTLDEHAPQLLGSRCRSCGTCYFPKQSLYCRNPACDSTEFDEAPLSRRGTLWSCTNAAYAPPEPYVAATPYEPFAIAAVELAAEKMVVLGQVVAGVGPEDLRVGQTMELVLETLSEDAESIKLIWKWKPVTETAS